jgi:hypothetical protein
MPTVKCSSWGDVRKNHLSPLRVRPRHRIDDADHHFLRLRGRAERRDGNEQKSGKQRGGDAIHVVVLRWLALRAPDSITRLASRDRIAADTHGSARKL